MPCDIKKMSENICMVNEKKNVVPCGITVFFLFDGGGCYGGLNGGLGGQSVWIG